MIKGIKVTLIANTLNGVDAFNQPTYTEERIEIDNVLVGEPSTDDIVNDLQAYGKRLAYTLAIPKGDTNTWEDCVVEFDPTGKGENEQKFKVYGNVTAGIEANIPLKWNKKVHVERYSDE